MASRAPHVVLGQGALGTLLATSLAGGSRPVHVVSRRAGEAKQVTLRARGRRRTREQAVQLVPEPPEEASSIVVATRADEAISRAREAEPALAEDGVIVSLQNGLVGLELGEELGEERVVPGIVGFNAQLRDERTVEVTSPGTVTLGALDPAAGGGLEGFVQALDRPVRAVQTGNVRGAVWSKFCVACAINGLALVAGEGVGPMTRRREGREALVSVLTEGTRLAEAEGVELERVAGPLAPDTIAGNASTGLGGAFRRGVAWLIGRRYSDVVPSSVAAFQAGRDPELDALNAEAVERGQRLDVATPWNRATLAVAEQILAGEREPDLGNLEEIRQRATGQA